jgi:hypothetical protein
MWVNANDTQTDGHWGWSYLNGSTDDTTTTPISGAPFNYQDFPYSNVYEGEVLVIPTCGVTGAFTTPSCSGSELQHNQAAREAHTWATYTNTFFNTQNSITAYSQDGTITAVSTDYACQFGQTDGGTGLCGFPWSPGYSYSVGALITPTSNTSGQGTNTGTYVYKASANCTSGTVQPRPFNQTVGGTTTEAGGTGPCVWTNMGKNKARGDVMLVWLQ